MWAHEGPHLYNLKSKKNSEHMKVHTYIIKVRRLFVMDFYRVYFIYSSICSLFVFVLVRVCLVCLN